MDQFFIKLEQAVDEVYWLVTWLPDDLFMNEKVNDKLMNSSGKDQNKKRKLLTITYVCCLFVSLYDPFPYPSLLRITNP